MRKSYLLELILIFMFSSSFGNAQSNIQGINNERPKIGLVLSGGGARGAAHVGVLKVLEENHIPVDMIAGTSFGAIVGGLYATGYSANELEEILNNIDWQTSLSNQAPRNQRSFRRKQDDEGFLIKFKLGFKDGSFNLPSGLITPNNLRLTLRDLVGDVSNITHFDNLPIPFRAVATDLATGDEVVLDQGDLTTAIVTSMTVPGLFPPARYKGKLLVDGGVTNNIPVNVAHAMGADIVIVVNVTATLLTESELTSFTSIIDQLTNILTHKSSTIQLDSLTDKDILIRPELDDIGPLDFELALDAIPNGSAAAVSMLSKLQPHALSEIEWQEHINKRIAIKKPEPTIAFIRIKNDSKIDDEVINSHLSIKVGQKFNSDQLTSDLTEIYGLDLFDEVNYRTIIEDDQTGIEIVTSERRAGEDYFRFGLALQDNFEGDSGFQLAAGFNNLAINERGGEWQTLFQIGDNFGLFTELYQPIDYSDRYYAFANAAANRTNRNILNNNGIIFSQVRLSQAIFQGGIGRNFDNWGTARVGLQRTYSKVRGRIGFDEDISIPIDTTELIAEFSIDTLDNIAFPRSGLSLDVQYTNSMPFLNGDNHVDSIEAGIYAPFSWGNNTLGFQSSFVTSFNGTPDETDLFSLGGFLNLTAYSPGQVTGNHGGFVSAIYYRQIYGGLQYLTETPVFVGASIETGNIWNQSKDISLNDLRWSSSIFVGADTLIGPVYLGLGIGDGGQTSTFLFVGQLF